MRFSARPAPPTCLHLMRSTLAFAGACTHRRRSRMITRLRRVVGWTAAIAGLLLLPSAHVFAQKIVTVAGNGTAGYVAAQDGGPATRAELDEPYSAAVDSAGNLYIAERANNRIRRVDATGLITTVAGNGQSGYRSADEGGPATAAPLNDPRGIAVDAAGNLFIAETGNHRVRKVDTGGFIRTVAGTGTPGFRAGDEGSPATGAELDSPRAVTVDRSGNLFISDYNNQRIREVDAATGAIRTVAGTGTAGYLAAQGGGPAAEAEINDPYGIAIDAAGNLYIADTGNHRVRRIEARTGIITTVAGNGTPGYRPADEGKPANRATLNAPCAVALDPVGNLYIADMAENRIRRVDAVTGVITTFAGSGVPGYILEQDGEAASLARLNKPRGLAVDPRGNLYIADSANNRVRKVEPSKPGFDVAIR